MKNILGLLIFVIFFLNGCSLKDGTFNENNTFKEYEIKDSLEAIKNDFSNGLEDNFSSFRKDKQQKDDSFLYVYKHLMES